MSKSVRIKEGSGAWQTESTDIIKTQLVEGGTQNWVPEEQYKSLLDKKVLNVTANGNYTPSSENCDCFSEVVVKLGDGEGKDGKNIYKGPDTVTGKDPNTGEPTSVSTDENGNIQFNQIPAFIKVTTPPNQTTYTEGTTIDYTGIIVCAYKNDGSAFPLENGSGTFSNQIPFSELTFPVTIATKADEAKMTFPDYQTTGTVTVTGLCDPTALYNALLSESIVGFEFENGVDSELQTFLMNAAGHFFVGRILNEDVRYEGWSPIDLFYSDEISVGDTITLGSNVSGYMFRTYGNQYSGELVNTITQCSTGSASWGTFVGKLDNNGRIIASNINASAGVPVHTPVQWYSKYRDEPYETTFDITVSES